MPYIKQDRRIPIDNSINVIEHVVTNCGDLNYTITKLCLAYIETKGLSYQTLNDIIGALECAKLEFNRRKIAPYEDLKSCENGDIVGYENKN